MEDTTFAIFLALLMYFKQDSENSQVGRTQSRILKSRILKLESVGIRWNPLVSVGIRWNPWESVKKSVGTRWNPLESDIF